MNEQLILDRYRLIERLAVGGSAEVWRAHDEQLDRPVAVKRLHPHLLPDEPSRRRLAAEARAAASLSHPVIVGIYDVDATGDAPVLVMELVDGESLSARIDREGPLEDRLAVGVTADVADALFHAHQRGVIHRDVKPGNVLLARDGRTRLVDFGIAHSLAESSERLTVTGTVMGTLSAMAPEQLAAGPITPRTDLYGLGVVLHQALTARPPYPSASPVALAEAQRAGPPDLAGIEPALAAVVASCLAWDPADRPLHAGALAAALRRWLAGDPSLALGLAPAATSGTVNTAAITQAVPVVVAPPRLAPEGSSSAAGRRRWPQAAIAVLALLVLGAIAVAMASGMRPPGDSGDDQGSPSAAATVALTPVPTAVPTPVPTAVPTAAPRATPVAPEWLSGLIDKVARECGDDRAAELAIQLATLSEDDAKDLADEQIKSCRDDEGGGNGDGGGGRGNDD